MLASHRPGCARTAPPSTVRQHFDPCHMHLHPPKRAPHPSPLKQHSLSTHWPGRPAYLSVCLQCSPQKTTLATPTHSAPHTRHTESSAQANNSFCHTPKFNTHPALSPPPTHPHQPPKRATPPASSCPTRMRTTSATLQSTSGGPWSSSSTSRRTPGLKARQGPHCRTTRTSPAAAAAAATVAC